MCACVCYCVLVLIVHVNNGCIYQLQLNLRYAVAASPFVLQGPLKRKMI